MKEWMKEVDFDGDGQLSFEEFRFSLGTRSGHLKEENVSCLESFKVDWQKLLGYYVCKPQKLLFTRQ